MASNGPVSPVKVGLRKIETHSRKENGICHDDSVPPVKAQTLDELHSLQKKRSAPTTPVNGSQGGPFAPLVSDDQRAKLQLQSISASLASLTRETGPKVVKGDPARKVETTPRFTSHVTSIFEPARTTDSALKFTHVLHNLSPAELYEQAIRYEHGSFITSTGALATLSGAKTGRSPRDKRVVKDEATEAELWWGKYVSLSLFGLQILLSICAS
ncbi:hypothetical protein AMTR_s00033p00012450 [Amborella trichopoda]|uniref:Phosphoenolpyruvate carboxykinase (ATP) n=1 Tax=Amborella trichopoda TaxID=13333 RepID=U5CVN0_AMBTC|nr:hypothetical protein AMTR_s00033p00012450 [Amborella trichopoda]